MSESVPVLQQQTIGDTPTDWSRTVPFNQSDPSQGTLQSIDVGLTADLSGSVSVESLEAAPSAVTIFQSGNVSVSGPTGMPVADESPSIFSNATLSAYDGTVGYAGPSGTVVPVDTTGTVVTTLSGSTDLGPFIGTGSVLVSAYASTVLDITGPANLRIDSRATTGATVDLQYNYGTTAAGPGGGAGGSVFTEATGPGVELSFANAATTAPQILTLADSTTGSSEQIGINRFNPALGILEGIDITLSGDLSTSVSAENEDATPGFVTTTQIATVTLSLPSVTEATSAPIDTSIELGGYDGTPDFAGTSGTIVQSQTLLPSTIDTLTDATDLAAFTGTGTVGATISSAGTSSLEGPGNLLAQLLAQAGGTVAVSYEYVPTGVSADAIGWDGQSSEWTNGIHWSSDPNPPASTDDVAITLPGTYTVTLDAAETVHSIVIDSPDATLVLDANLTATDNFILDAGTIDFNSGTIFAGDIAINGGLIVGDSIDLNSTGTFALNGGSVVATNSVRFTSDGGSITAGPTAAPITGIVTSDPGVPGFFTGAECFARGTRIATPHGAARVEDLAIGDLLLLGSGGTAPIAWIGHRQIDCHRHPQPHKVWPVRISRGAFGENRPHRDLLLSPDHAVFADDVLIPVKYLVNGTTIRQIRRHSIAYFHIELPRHDIVLAEGLPVESYLDIGNRDNFANNRGAVALYPDFASLMWEARGYAPLTVTGPELDAVQRKIDALASMAA